MNGDIVRLGTRLPAFTGVGDRTLQLKVGEIIRAQVVDVLAGGVLSLRIGDTMMQAKSEVLLPRDASVLLKVLPGPASGGGQELRLQVIQILDPGSTGVTSPNPEVDAIKALLQQLGQLVAARGEVSPDFSGVVENLLKTLPGDPGLLPRGIREQLQMLLQTGLRTTGQSIQERMNSLLTEPLLQQLGEHLDLGNVRDELMTDIGRLYQKPLQGVLENTGVVLEARLRALLQSAPGELELPKAAIPGGEPQPSLSPPEALVLKSDLKARLLQIRQFLVDRETKVAGSASALATADSKPAEAGKTAEARMTTAIDTLLNNIETLQLLSKLTNSFYTFLPVLWEGLKHAEIAFKKNRSGPAGNSYYCLINLDFDELGKLTIMAMMQDKEFFVSFKTENSALQSVLNNNVPELQSMFQSQGLKLKVVNFLKMHETTLAPFESLESFDNIINIKV
jgi:hypothetical protein